MPALLAGIQALNNRHHQVGVYRHQLQLQRQVEQTVGRALLKHLVDGEWNSHLLVDLVVGPIHQPPLRPNLSLLVGVHPLLPPHLHGINQQPKLQQQTLALAQSQLKVVFSQLTTMS